MGLSWSNRPEDEHRAFWNNLFDSWDDDREDGDRGARTARGDDGHDDKHDDKEHDDKRDADSSHDDDDDDHRDHDDHHDDDDCLDGDDDHDDGCDAGPPPPPPPPPANHAPVFIEPNPPSLTVGVGPLGSTVTQAVATDLDVGDTLIYSLSAQTVVGSEDSEFFAIDPATGDITLIQAVTMTGSNDGDEIYSLQVQVTDGTDVATLDIDIVFVFGA